MRTRLIVIWRIGREHTAQLRLAEHNDLIQAFAAQRADQTFGNAILPWRATCDRPVTDAHRSDTGGENMSIGAVIVTHEVGRASPTPGILRSSPLRKISPRV